MCSSDLHTLSLSVSVSLSPAPLVRARRRAGALPGFCRFPRRGTTASRVPGRTSGQHFAPVPQVGLKRLGPHVRTRETQSLVCKEPLPSSGLGQLRPSPLLPTPPRVPSSVPPRVPSSVPRHGPTSWRAEAPWAPRRSSGAPGRAGAAGGEGPGRHGPQPPALVSAGPLPAPSARVPAARPPLWASRGRARPAAPSSPGGAAALSRAARPAGPRPPPLSELIRSWRAPGPLPRQRLSQGRADSSGSSKQDLLPDSSLRPFWGVGRWRLNPFFAGDHRVAGSVSTGPGVYPRDALSRGLRP